MTWPTSKGQAKAAKRKEPATTEDPKAAKAKKTAKGGQVNAQEAPRRRECRGSGNVQRLAWSRLEGGRRRREGRGRAVETVAQTRRLENRSMETRSMEKAWMERRQEGPRALAWQ